MLQLLHGGAAARPFVTHSNALDTDLYLRIAPELFLKRAVVGGIDRVFEINRNFRNEGIDSTHSPEFAMLEAYQAYGDYDTMADADARIWFRRRRSRSPARHVVTHADGTEFDLGGEWRSVTLFGVAFRGARRRGDRPTPIRASWCGTPTSIGLAVDPKWGPGKLAEELFEELVVPGLQAPTFVRDYPEETSSADPGAPRPSRAWRRSGTSTSCGFELGTAYSELVDPVVQRERLVAQAQLAAEGDDEAMRLDEDFLRAMEYGMPPAGGMGMGIDRLLMALTGLGIRETILFPLVRPE